MKCPICDKEVQEQSSDYMEHILCEDFAKCEDERHFYHYQYSYGSTEEVIGSVVFHSHHADSSNVRKLRNKQYKAVLELARENYHKEK